jgi:hypothetical protein
VPNSLAILSILRILSIPASTSHCAFLLHAVVYRDPGESIGDDNPRFLEDGIDDSPGSSTSFQDYNTKHFPTDVKSFDRGFVFGVVSINDVGSDRILRSKIVVRVNALCNVWYPQGL